MKRRSVILLVLVLAVVGGIGWYATKSLFLTEYREVRTKTAKFESQAKSFSAGAKGSRATKIGLRDAATTMLASEPVVVEHRLRGMLSELAERHGLADIVVSHSRPKPAGNPADDRGSKVNRSLRRLLGKQTDFAVIQGRLQGVGSLEQVIETLADLRAQSWIHRVEGFTISPKGRDRTSFELKADYATIFAPDLVDSDREPPKVAQPAESDLVALRAIAARSPFRFAEPVVPVVVVVPEPVRVAVEPGPPYDKWRVTGVLETLDVGTVEVMLARIDTGETKTLKIGQGILGATLTEASGERAWFIKDGMPVVVRAGETLDQARPAESVHSQESASG